MSGHFILLDESVFPGAMQGSTHMVNHLPQRVIQNAVFIAIAQTNGEIRIVKDRNGGNEGLVLSKKESDSIKAELKKTLGISDGN